MVLTNSVDSLIGATGYIHGIFSFLFLFCMMMALAFLSVFLSNGFFFADINFFYSIVYLHYFVANYTGWRILFVVVLTMKRNSLALSMSTGPKLSSVFELGSSLLSFWEHLCSS